MSIRAAAAELLMLLDENPDATWPHCTEAVEVLREALRESPVAWRVRHDGRWVYTTKDPRIFLRDVDPEALYL